MWNSFLGNLPYQDFCLAGHTVHRTHQSHFHNAANYQTVGIRLNFSVQSDIIKDKSVEFLTLNLTGRDLGTRLKGTYMYICLTCVCLSADNNLRIDANISIDTQINVSKGKLLYMHVYNIHNLLLIIALTFGVQSILVSS